MIMRRQPHPTAARDGWQESGLTGHRVDPASAATPRRLADQKRSAGAQGYALGGKVAGGGPRDDGLVLYLERGYVVVSELERDPGGRHQTGGPRLSVGEESLRCGGFKNPREDLS